MEGEGIRVEIRRKPGSDRALISASRGLRRQALVGLLALPLLVLGVYPVLLRVIEAAKADPVGEAVLIVVALAFTAVVLVREYRRHMRPPRLPGQRWCSPHALYPGPHDENAAGFEGSRGLADNGPLPVVRLVLTASSVVILPTGGDDQPLTCDLPDIAMIGITCAGRRESGVTITRRDGRVARFIFKPDRKLVRELERLGATVSTVDRAPS